MTQADAGWSEVERRMSAPWVKVAAATVVGALSGALFFDDGWAGPTWALSLGPALAGLVEGLLLAHDGIMVLSTGATPGTSRRSRPLRLPVLAAFACATAAIAFVEQRFANVVALPFILRAAFVGGLVGGTASLVGHRAFAAEPGGAGTVVE